MSFSLFKSEFEGMHFKNRKENVYKNVHQKKVGLESICYVKTSHILQIMNNIYFKLQSFLKVHNYRPRVRSNPNSIVRQT